MKKSPRISHLLVLGLATGSGLATLQGCEDPTGVCDLSCPAEGVADGNASISGIASFDAFFGAVISLRDASANVNADMRAELEGLAAALEIEGAAEMSMDELSAAVAAALQLKLDGYVEGGLTLSYQPPRCDVNLEVVANAAAECDVEATPGEVKVECSGSCEVSAQAQAQCAAEGNLTCTGQAPGFDCNGTCTGACEADVAFECGGSCLGACEGTCTVCAGGDCEDDGNGVITNCAGACMGMCDGTCELEAGGQCDFRCEGSCEYDPGGAECEAGASAKCDVSASAEVECEGKCEGEASPPEVSAECQAAVEAKASAEVECTPPAIGVDFQFKAGLDADARAEFKSFLEILELRFAGMVAANAKIEHLQPAVVQVGAAAKGAVEGAIQAAGEGDLSVQVVLGLRCAGDEVKVVPGIVEEVGANLEASVSAFVEVAAVIGG